MYNPSKKNVSRTPANSVARFPNISVSQSPGKKFAKYKRADKRKRTANIINGTRRSFKVSLMWTGMQFFIQLTY